MEKAPITPRRLEELLRSEGLEFSTAPTGELVVGLTHMVLVLHVEEDGYLQLSGIWRGQLGDANFSEGTLEILRCNSSTLPMRAFTWDYPDGRSEVGCEAHAYYPSGATTEQIKQFFDDSVNLLFSFIDGFEARWGEEA